MTKEEEEFQKKIDAAVAAAVKESNVKIEALQAQIAERDKTITDQKAHEAELNDFIASHLTAAKDGANAPGPDPGKPSWSDALREAMAECAANRK